MTRSAFLISLLFFCLLPLSVSFAQTDNDLYLFSLEKSAKGEYHLHGAKYLNDFNRGGYTNQPSFTPGGDLLVSVRKPDENQNDIWQLSLTTRKYKRLTKTRATEYSPRIHPDEEQLTVLRKLEGETVDQQVCNIHLKSGEMECLAGDMRDVGYYTWLTPASLALFRLDGSGNRLNYYDANENKSRRITTSVGRTLMTDKAGNLIYIHKFTDEYWYIKKYNPSNSSIEIITQTIGKNEDFTMTSDGTYFMGKDNLLFSFHPDRGKEWKQVADLSIYGIKYISRLAVSPDSKKLVVVAAKTKS
jgi:Tol biopolymer transport system component